MNKDRKKNNTSVVLDPFNVNNKDIKTKSTEATMSFLLTWKKFRKKISTISGVFISILGHAFAG